MQRRKFIRITVAGSAAVSLTGLYCNSRKPAFYAVLDKPRQLAYICDTKAIQEIGKAYRLQTVSESRTDQLIGILSADSTGKPLSDKADDRYVDMMIEKKITDDFEKGNTVVLNGWILSVTEARQCALFSLENK
jgi:hypothetical protein